MFSALSRLFSCSMTFMPYLVFFGFMILGMWMARQGRFDASTAFALAMTMSFFFYTWLNSDIGVTDKNVTITDQNVNVLVKELNRTNRVIEGLSKHVGYEYEEEKRERAELPHEVDDENICYWSDPLLSSSTPPPLTPPTKSPKRRSNTRRPTIPPRSIAARNRESRDCVVVIAHDLDLAAPDSDDEDKKSKNVISLADGYLVSAQLTENQEKTDVIPPFEIRELPPPTTSIEQEYGDNAVIANEKISSEIV